jgi:DNA invertase Pin-like site-specific DNA recombinase
LIERANTSQRGFSHMLIGYMRVSTDNDRQTTDLQWDALLAAGVDARHVFEDKASGARDDRPGLQECLDYLEPGDTLVVWKLDRLGRSLSHLITIVEDLRKNGVAFRSLTEGMDTSNPHGELLFHLFGALAQYERALTKERVHAGLAAARRRGRYGGRPQAVDSEKLEAILAALESGSSKAAVCRNFAIPRSTLLDTLARAGWTGTKTVVN